MSILPLPLCSSHPTSSSLPLITIFTRSPLQTRFSSPSVSSVSSGSSGSYSSSPSVFSLDDSNSSAASSAASSAIIPPLPGPFNEERYACSGRTFLNCNRTSLRCPPSLSGSEKSLPKDQLRNPRRSGRLLVTHPNGCPDPSPSYVSALPPPSLLRQSERKVNFVDSLVDTAAQIIEAIWPHSTTSSPPDEGQDRIIPLRTFIQETLKRSRTSYSTLQVALYYLIVLRPHVPACAQERTAHAHSHSAKALNCGRRMFLAALIIASKYLQDRNYSARAWSKISGLNTTEINVNETTFLTAVNWKLHISDIVFEKWTNIVLKYTPTSLAPDSKAGGVLSGERNTFSKLILALTPDLEISRVSGFEPRVESSGPPYPLLRHSSLGTTETYDKTRRTPFLPPALVSREGARTPCGGRGDVNRANSWACGSSSGRTGPKAFANSCVTYDSRSRLSSDDVLSRTERRSNTLPSTPSDGYSETESSVSSSPESTCSVFSKTSRSSSISSISSGESAVDSNSPVTLYRENSAKRPLCHDPEPVIGRNAPSLRATSANITLWRGQRTGDPHRRLLNCSIPSAEARNYRSSSLHNLDQCGSPCHSTELDSRQDVPSSSKRIKCQYLGHVEAKVTSSLSSPTIRDSLYV